MKMLGKGVAVFAAAALSVVCLNCLSACSKADDSKAVNLWDAEFAQARASTDDPTLLKILADGKITDEEFAQAQQMDIDCVLSRFPKLQLVQASGGTIGSLSFMEHGDDYSQDQVQQAEQECSAIPAPVTSLYIAIQMNPQKADQAKVILDCLKKFGVVDGSMTLDQLRAVDPNNPPWDPLSGDAYGCEINQAAYQGGQPALTAPQQWPDTLFQ
jgi:hypothetical protein